MKLFMDNTKENRIALHRNGYCWVIGSSLLNFDGGSGKYLIADTDRKDNVMHSGNPSKDYVSLEDILIREAE